MAPGTKSPPSIGRQVWGDSVRGGRSEKKSERGKKIREVVRKKKMSFNSLIDADTMNKCLVLNNRLHCQYNKICYVQ